MIPPQTGLRGDRNPDCIDYLLGYLQHFRDVLQHTRTSSLAGNFLHRTTEVEVDDIRTCLLHHFGSLNHSLHIATINLDAYRSLFIGNGQLADGRLDITHQCLSRYELCVHHRCTIPLAQQPETNVRHILHRGKEYRALTQVNVAYLHFRTFG